MTETAPAEIQTERKHFKVGDGTPGPGRPAGLQNRTTRLLKDAIMQAAEIAGDRISVRDEYPEGTTLEEKVAGLTRYCVYLAECEPKAFAQLMARVMPLQIAGEFAVQTKDSLTLLMDAVNGSTRSK